MIVFVAAEPTPEGRATSVPDAVALSLCRLERTGQRPATPTASSPARRAAIGRSQILFRQTAASVSYSIGVLRRKQDAYAALAEAAAY